MVERLSIVSSPTSASHALLPNPRGWYAVAFATDLRPGAVAPRTLAGEELAVMRTASGVAAAFGAHCPHLGAHLGRAGSVEGETVRCRFHGFRFDTSGACVATGYGGAPPKARARVVPLVERHGVVFAWHHPARAAPDFDLPDVAMAGWAPLRTHRFSLRGHPQETTENSVDIGHLAVVHGYHDVRTLRPARTEGAYLHARYAMSRFVGLGPIGVTARSEFDVHVHGLGHSFVEVSLPDLGLELRHFVFATPTEPGRIDLRIACSVRAPAVRARLGGLAARAVAEAANRALIAMYVHDVGQDVAIWEHKAYLRRPALAAGDGPIGLYRRWAAQFYVDEAAARSRAAGADDPGRPRTLPPAELQ